MRLLILLCFFVASPAYAQNTGQCGLRKTLLPQIKGGQYDEDLIGLGVSKFGSTLYEFFTNEETGTWTLVATKPNPAGVMISCVVASGNGWNESHEPKGEES